MGHLATVNADDGRIWWIGGRLAETGASTTGRRRDLLPNVRPNHNVRGSMSTAEQPTPTAAQPATPTQKRGFVANVLIVSGGTVFAQVISLLTAPILARLFDPEAFGIATIFGTICAIVGVIGCLRYDGAVLLPKDAADGSAVLVLSIVAATAIAALSALVLMIAGEPLLRSINGEALWPFAWLIPVGIFLQSLAWPLPLFAQRIERFDLVTVVRVFSQLTTIVVSIGVGWAGFQTGRDLIYARSATILLLVPLPLGAWILMWPAAAGWRTPSLARIKQNALRYREFPLINLWAALLDIAALQMTPLVLAALFTPTVVGLFSMAIRLVNLPCQFVSTSIAQVFFQHAAHAHATGDKAAFSRSVDAVTRRLVTLGVLPVLLVALLGPSLIGLVFGERWLTAGYYVAMLAPETLAMFITSPIVPLLYVLELHRYNVLFQGLLLMLRCGSLWLGATITGTPEGALLASAVAVPFGLAALNVFLLRTSDVSVRRIAGHLAQHLLAALPCALTWFALERVLELNWIVTAIGTIAAGAPYVWLVMRKDPEAVALLWQYLRKLRDMKVPR